ncbi:MAG: hypothetical protein NZZ41_07570 [Candidatus Dojkabacteria bacterium]|nr:hypothetical protein [Candidatus Dojkabacteria bacterium]
MSNKILEIVETTNHIPLTNIVFVTDDYEIYNFASKNNKFFSIYIPKEIILYGKSIEELKKASELLYNISQFCDQCLILTDDDDYFVSVASNVSCEVNIVNRKDFRQNSSKTNKIRIRHA